MMRHRPFGRQLYAVGGNPEVARLAGYDVRRDEIHRFIICSLLAGVSGILLSSRLGSAVHVAGLGFEFQVVAAVVLGGVSLAGGVGSLFGVALGVLILSFLPTGSACWTCRPNGSWSSPASSSSAPSPSTG